MPMFGLSSTGSPRLVEGGGHLHINTYITHATPTSPQKATIPTMHSILPRLISPLRLYSSCRIIDEDGCAMRLLSIPPSVVCLSAALPPRLSTTFSGSWDSRPDAEYPRSPGPASPWNLPRLCCCLHGQRNSLTRLYSFSILYPF